MEDICQSCGMPMRKKEDYGTDELGNPSEEYCCHCFHDGKFTTHLTMNEYIDHQVGILTIKMGMPEHKAREIANRIIHTLKRWKI